MNLWKLLGFKDTTCKRRKTLTVYCIVDCKGKLVSAWPSIGKAKTQCRTELKDRVIVRDLLCTEPTCAKPKKKAKPKR